MKQFLFELTTNGCSHLLRVEPNPWNNHHTIYLDQELLISHDAKMVDNYALYSLDLDGEQVEILLHFGVPHYTVNVFVNDRSVSDELLPLSEYQANHRARYAMPFGGFCRSQFAPVLFHWGIWFLLVTVFRGLTAGYRPVQYLVAAGYFAVLCALCVFAELFYRYKSGRKLADWSDCRQHPQHIGK